MINIKYINIQIQYNIRRHAESSTYKLTKNV